MKTIEELKNKVIQGDCLDKLKELKDNSVDAVITDPPYGLSFMGKHWDYDVPSQEIWAECLRVLKPGGYLLAFAGTRTQHRMAVRIEDAGFEIRDMIFWTYASGFPKSLNIFKQLKKNCTCGNMEEYEKKAISGKQNTEHDLRPMSESNLSQTKSFEEKQGEVLQSGLSEQSVSLSGQTTSDDWREKSSLERRDNLQKTERELQRSDVSEMPEGVSADGEERRIHNATQISNGSISEQTTDKNRSSASHRPQSSEQQDREPCAFCKQYFTQAVGAFGYGSALKPACEPISVCRKPISEKNLADNYLKWGVGGINIDASRVRGEYNLQGNDLSDMISLCQLNHLHLPVNSAEKRRFQEDMTSLIGSLCSVLVNADMSILEKALGIMQEDTDTMGMLCSEEMLMENINTSLNTFMSGNELMEKYQRDLRYIISMVLKMITDWKISNALIFQLTGVLLIKVKKEVNTQGVQGRFPANLLHDGSDEVVGLFPSTKGGTAIRHNSGGKTFGGDNEKPPMEDLGYGDSGSAARFFYCAKASKSERNRGCEGLKEKRSGALEFRNRESGKGQFEGEPQFAKNNHPTVKPIALMEYLVKLVSREGAVVLDPFSGSGSTGIACKNLNRNYILIEKEPEYVEIINKRLLSADNLFTL